MGHDHAADVKAVKRFAAFAANTWGHNVNSIRANGSTVNPVTPSTTVLQTVVKEDGSGLHCLVLQVGDLVGAVKHVREGTLLAGLKGKGGFGGERDEVAGRIKGADVAEKGRLPSGANGAAKGDDVSEDESSIAEDGGAGKGNEVEGGEEKPSKIQILMWRSEGMAQYMADELGPKFKIPKGFY